VQDPINLYIYGFILLALVLIGAGFGKNSAIKIENITVVGSLIVALVVWSLINERGTIEDIITMGVKYRSSAYLMTLYSVFVAMVFHKIRLVKKNKECN